MIKLDFDLEDLNFDDIVEGMRSRLNAAAASATQEMYRKGREQASSELHSQGYKQWKRGFEVDKIDDSSYVVTVRGKLAMWMENGIDTGEISKAIMNGNRARYNKSIGKHYVDVPFFKSAEEAERYIQTDYFADADAKSKMVTFSDYKKGGVKHEERSLSRVEDLIRSEDPKTGNVRFLTIRRVNDKSVWPKSPIPGVKILENLESDIEKVFDDILDRIL